MIPELTGGSLQMQHWHLNQEFPCWTPVGFNYCQTRLFSPFGLLWFLAFMYSRCSLPSFWRCSYLSQHGLFLFGVLNNECALSGRPFSFSLAPKWHPAPPPPPLASHPHPLYFLLSCFSRPPAIFTLVKLTKLLWFFCTFPIRHSGTIVSFLLCFVRM